MKPNQFTIEGYTIDEILSLPDEHIEALMLTAKPLVFRAGSAQILGEISIKSHRLVVELAQIEGGGEGVLLPLWLLAERYAIRKGLDEVEWIIHAIHCAQPNLKLKRVLERRNFVIPDVPGYGEAYYKLHRVIRK